MAFRKALVSADTPADCFPPRSPLSAEFLVLLLLYFSPPPQLWGQQAHILESGRNQTGVRFHSLGCGTSLLALLRDSSQLWVSQSIPLFLPLPHPSLPEFLSEFFFINNDGPHSRKSPVLISGDNDCFCRRDPDGFSVSVSIICTEIHTSLKADGKSVLPCAGRGAGAGLPLTGRPSGQLGTDEARAWGPGYESRELDA